MTKITARGAFQRQKTPRSRGAQENRWAGLDLITHHTNLQNHTGLKTINQCGFVFRIRLMVINRWIRLQIFCWQAIVGQPIVYGKL